MPKHSATPIIPVENQVRELDATPPIQWAIPLE
jgi:hypothetical protein